MASSTSSNANLSNQNDKRVVINIKNQIAYVTLNHASKHNALDMPMFYQIKATIKQLKKNKKVRAVIVSGDGEDFCTGLDIKSVMKSASAPIKLLFKWLPWQSNLAQIVSTGWRKVPAPVIMAIHGRCWGGGLQIALGGDFRIVTPDASIAIMEARWGLIPDMGGTIALRELVTKAVATELAMTGQIISGQQALSYGLVSHVEEKPLEKAQQMAELICQQSPDAVAASKKLYNKSWFGFSGFALARESYYQFKILLGKNSKIKAYNQTHQKDVQKVFVDRKPW